MGMSFPVPSEDPPTSSVRMGPCSLLLGMPVNAKYPFVCSLLVSPIRVISSPLCVPRCCSMSKDRAVSAGAPLSAGWWLSSASFFPGWMCTGPGFPRKEGWGIWSTRGFAPESLGEEEKTSDHSGHASERVCVYLWEWLEAEGVDGCLEQSHHPALMSTGRIRQAGSCIPPGCSFWPHRDRVVFKRVGWMFLTVLHFWHNKKSQV